MRNKLMSLFIIPFLLLSFFPHGVKGKQQHSLANEIIYDIIVDRFNNGGQAASDQIDLEDPLAYHGGDILGITKQLDYIQQYGFTAISLSPIMENAPGGFHGYWVEDFYTVEQEFGQIDDVKHLVEEAHSREMKVILELVINYVAKTSPLVEEHPDWFQAVDVEPIPATEWLNEVVAFDQTNPEVQEFLIDVAKFWMEKTGVDGFKLHAADQTDESFLEQLTNELKTEDPHFFLIATTLQGNDDVDYLYDIEHLDAIANHEVHELMNEVFKAPNEPVNKLTDFRGDDASNRDLLFVDNKQTGRFSNHYSEQGRNDETAWTLALSYMFFTPGVPIVFQGSEIPTYGPEYPHNQYLVDFISADPDMEKVYERLSAIRKQFPALVHGDFEEIAVEGGFSLFKRTLDDETVYVAINNDTESRNVTIPGLGSGVQLRGLIHDDTIRERDNGEMLIGLNRESAEVFIIEPNTGFNWGFIAFVVGVLLAFIVIVIILSRKQKKRESSK